MAESSTYSPRSSAYWAPPSVPGQGSPAIAPDTPPPPPPKPSSHDVSRQGTPLSGPGPTSRPPPIQSPKQPETPRQATGAGEEQQQQQAQQVQELPEPPRIEDGWLPDVVKDKSYALLHHNGAGKHEG